MKIMVGTEKMTMYSLQDLAHEAKKGVNDYNDYYNRAGKARAKYVEHNLICSNGNITLAVTVRLPDGGKNNHNIAL